MINYNGVKLVQNIASKKTNGIILSQWIIQNLINLFLGSIILYMLLDFNNMNSLILKGMRSMKKNGV